MVAAPIAVSRRGGDGQRPIRRRRRRGISAQGNALGFSARLKRRPEGAQEVSIEPAPTTRLDWINGRYRILRPIGSAPSGPNECDRDTQGVALGGYPPRRWRGFRRTPIVAVHFFV